jgi:predicted PurR-regulated permease PerM
MPHWLAIVTVLLVILGSAALALVVLVPLLIDQLTDLVAAWPGIMDNLSHMLGDLARPLRDWGLLQGGGTDLSDRFREGLRERSQMIVQGLLAGLLNVASGAIGFLIQLFAVLFIAVYLLVDVRKVQEAVLRLPPARYRDDAPALCDAFSASISRYFGGVILMAAFQGGLAALALWALGVPYPLIHGAWVAVTLVIPYLGAYLGAIPALLVALTISPTTAVLTLLLYVIIQQVESNILTPRVQGKAAQMHPIIVLLAVIWAGQALGLLGSIFAVPMLVVVRVLLNFFKARLRVRRDQEIALG